MTVTEYGYCQHCDERKVELIMTTAGVLACSQCEAVNVYETKEAYEKAVEKREQ